MRRRPRWPVDNDEDYKPWGEPSPPEDYRRWNLEDALTMIDTAERALTNGCGMFERHCHLATLAGRTPDQARADARALYAP